MVDTSAKGKPAGAKQAGQPRNGGSRGSAVAFGVAPYGEGAYRIAGVELVLPAEVEQALTTRAKEMVRRTERTVTTARVPSN